MCTAFKFEFCHEGCTLNFIFVSGSLNYSYIYVMHIIIAYEAGLTTIGPRAKTLALPKILTIYTE